MQPNIMIVGHGEHGKDKVAELLVANSTLTHQSSSRFALDRVVWPKWGHKIFVNPQQCFERRRQWRNTWKMLISAYNTPDKARLIKELYHHYNIYVGCRCIEELTAAREVIDLTIWVDASDRKPPEKSNTITPADCDIMIDNNGTLAELQQRVVNLARLF